MISRGRHNGCLRWLWSSEAHYGRLLAPYLDNAAHAFIISSDFCHWGTRFNYLFYERSRARTLRITSMAAWHSRPCNVAGTC